MAHYEIFLRVYKQYGPIASWSSLISIAPVRIRALRQKEEVELAPLFDLIRNNKIPQDSGLLRYMMAEVLLNIGDQHINEAEDSLCEAIELVTKYGMRWQLARSYTLYSQIFKRQNNLPQARDQMNKAIDIMKECGADGWVERYEKELAKLEANY